jgi:hypothetical protein
VFVAMIENFGLSKPSDEKTSGANVKIAKYGATRQVKKIEANAVLRQVSRANRRAKEARSVFSSPRSSSS